MKTIIANWLYLKYVLRHKWFVFRACIKFRSLLMVWRGIIHDWQKFTPAEWSPYVQTFYGEWDYNDRPQWLMDQFDRAWNHHIHYGPHHWQYWVLHEDDGDTKCLEMPTAYYTEMVADWSGAGMAIHGNPDPFDWYMKNREKIMLHPTTRQYVRFLLRGHWFGGTHDPDLEHFDLIDAGYDR